MGLTDFSTGVQGGLQQLIARRVAEQQRAQALKQQQFQNERMLKSDAMAQEQLNATLEGNAFNRTRQAELDKSLIADRQASAAHTQKQDAIASRETQIPGTIVGAQSPAVDAWTKADVPIGNAVPGVAPRLYTSPTDKQGMPGAAPTSPAGYLLTPTSAQAKAKTDDDRQAARDAADEQYRRESLGIARQNVNSAGNAREMAAQMAELKLQAERNKLEQATTDRTAKAEEARSATQTALDLADRLEKHKGFSTAYGYVSSRMAPFSQDATDAGAIRDQLVAALTLPNLGALKGPMSDKDVVFVKSLSTRLGNPLISDGEARKAIAEAKTFLQSKIGTVPMVAPDGRQLNVPADKVAELEAKGARRR